MKAALAMPARMGNISNVSGSLARASIASALICCVVERIAQRRCIMMKNNDTGRIRALLLALALLIGCNGDGGSDGNGRDIALARGTVGESLSLVSLFGVYTLIDFTFTNEEGSLTADDVDDFSGSLRLSSAGTFLQVLTIDGTQTTTEGTYGVVSDTTLLVSIPVFPCRALIVANLHQGILRLFLSAEQSAQCGGRAEENTVWELN